MKNGEKRTLKDFCLLPLIPVISFLHPNETNAQQILNSLYPNTVYGVIYPGDLGLGIRYDKRFKNKFYSFGAYSSVAKGKYRLGEETYVKGHFKAAFGFIYYPPFRSFEESEGFFGAGISYHKYGNKNDPWEIIDERGLKPISVDLSAGSKEGRFSYVINFDPFKREGGMAFGYNFGPISKDKMKKYKRLLAEIKRR